MYNPSDETNQQCEITLCIHCHHLTAQNPNSYHQAFWKSRVKMTFHSSIPDDFIIKKNESNISFSILKNGVLFMRAIHQNDTSPIESEYPIINFNFPQIILPQQSYRVKGKLILGDIDWESSYLPDIKRSTIKYLTLSSNTQTLKISLSEHGTSIPIIIDTYETCPIFYWLRTPERLHNQTCLEKVTIAIKEAAMSMCSPKSGKHIDVFITTVYKLTDILMKPLQINYQSCYLSIELKQQRKYNAFCAVDLHRETSCLSMMHRESTSDSFYKCPDEENCIELETDARIYR